MKNVNSQRIPPAGIATASGILITLGLLLFINVLAQYRSHVTETRPLLVVDLAAWPLPRKQEKQPTPPKPEKQPVPKRTAVKKPPAPPKPELSPQAKKTVEKVPEKTLEPEEEVMEQTKETDKPSPAEPMPPMLIEPAEDAMPNPVPIFKLTQAPHFLHREIPVYPETMRTQGISGIVKLEALIDKEGRVRKVKILKSAGKYFDEAAKHAILASTFYPAEVENKPVAVLLRLPVQFDLL